MMKISIFVVLLLGLQDVASVMHSWKAFYTGTTGMSEFPEFVALNLLDDELMGYFDSKTNRFEGKQSWVTEKLGQEYVEQQTNVLRGYVPTFKGNIDIAMKRFNQSQGVHIFQFMYGCEWDDETGDVKGQYQYGYDGEDFIIFDTKTQINIAPVQEAIVTKNKWDSDKAKTAYRMSYLTQECPDWLKKYVNYGRSTLMRKDIPSVFLLQKTPSSPVTCHATGFYPDKAEMFWRKSGEELHEHVEKGEIVPNNDGSFQMDVKLSHPSIESEDWTNYECVFQLSGKKDIITKLEKTKIITNKGNSNVLIIPVVVAVVVLVVIALIGFVVYKKKNAKRPPSPVEAADVQQQMLPE